MNRVYKHENTTLDKEFEALYKGINESEIKAKERKSSIVKSSTSKTMDKNIFYIDDKTKEVYIKLGSQRYKLDKTED